MFFTFAAERVSAAAYAPQQTQDWRIFQLARFLFLYVSRIMMDEEDRPLSIQEITLVVQLLAGTDITLNEIADKIQRPLNAVHAINRKYNARDFRDRRMSRMTVANGVSGSRGSET